MDTLTIDGFVYEGIFLRHHGLQYEINLFKENNKIRRVVVAPSLSALEIIIPEEIKPEISNIVRDRFGFKGEPIYLNPGLN